jgi:hypothetical protein
MVGLMAALERYREIHGDYPRLPGPMTGDASSRLLNSALKGKIEPLGTSVPDDPADADQNDRKKVNLITTKIREVDSGDGMKFIDWFGNDYEYYYGMRSDINNNTWMRLSFVLLSRGADGVRSVTVGSDGVVSRDRGDDIVADNTGIL